MSKALVLLSGGIDSAVTMMLACAKHGPAVLCLAFDYGQRHAIEIEAAAEIAAWRGLNIDIIEVPNLLFGDSPILKRGDESGISDTPEGPGPSSTVVPFRNGVLLSIATSQAISHGATEVWAGYHKSDWATGGFPDCSPEFVHAMSLAMKKGSVHEVEGGAYYREVLLYTPLLDMTKDQILGLAIEQHLPLHETVSCYRGRPACGTCPTCRQRLAAFDKLGITDPIEYAATPS